MRFAHAHKVSTYAMVTAAFLALVSGGSVSPVASLGGAIGLVASWFFEPPRVSWERWTLPLNVISLLVLAWAVFTSFATGDFLGVGGSFLIWIVVAKAFQRRTPRDWQQLHLLAFLMLIAGSVLNEDLSYGICFLAFVVTATWARILFHLRREIEDHVLVKHGAAPADRARVLDSRRVVDRRFFVGTGLVSVAIFATAAVIFLAIPRVGAGLFYKSRSQLSMAGFSDGVSLGGHGRIKNDTTVVMRVQVDQPFQGRSAPYIYWRGVAFDTYWRGSWSRSQRAPRTRATTLDDRGTLQRFLHYDGGADLSLPADVTKQSIWLEHLESDVLFGGSMPRAYQGLAASRRPSASIERNDEIRHPHAAAIQYTVWSTLTPPPPAALRSARGPLPDNFEVYTRLPRGQITPRTLELAQTITRDADNDYDRAVAIRDWLNRNLTYTLDLEEPGDREPIDFFLFERKKGHCEYFASAFVVLARSVGIPSRNVNGFLGGEWNEYDDYIAVRAGDAHSWAEVYFPGQGWVTFDATPAADQLGRGGAGLFDRMGRLVDSLRFQWNQWVIDFDVLSQLELLRDVGGWFRGLGGELSELGGASWAGLRAAWPWLAGAAGIAGLGVAWRRRRRRAAPADAPMRRSELGLIYARAQRELGRVGIRRAPGTTPRELAAQLEREGRPGARTFDELTEIYYRAEWSGAEAAGANAKARDLLSALKRELTAAKRSPPP